MSEKKSKMPKLTKEMNQHQEVPLTLSAPPGSLMNRPKVFQDNGKYGNFKNGIIKGFEKFKAENSSRLVPKLPEPEKLPLKLYKCMNNCAIVLMPHPYQIQICGCLKITVLMGSITVSGHLVRAESHQNSVTIFASKDFQSCLIETRITSTKLVFEEILKTIPLSSKDSLELGSHYVSNNAVIMIEEEELPPYFNAKKYWTKNLLPITDKSYSALDVSPLKCAIDGASSEFYSPTIVPPEWKSLILGMSNVIVGVASSGKTTLAKYIVNKLLEKNPTVLYLELDIGQGEFSVAGSLAVLVLKKPIFGPNFTHVTEPERMIQLGDVDVTRCSTDYIIGVQYLVDFATQNFPDIPWVVNTMGLFKGLGFQVTKKCIQIINPSTVIQINLLNKNATYNLVAENVGGNFHFITLQSVAESTKRYGSNKEARERMLISYFSSMLTPPDFSFNTVEPYCASFHNITIGVMHNISTSDILRAINGTIVSLSEAPLDAEQCLSAVDNSEEWFKILVKPEVMPSLGLGIIRGISMEKKELYVLSPIPGSVMERVRMLCMTNIEVPANMYLNQQGVDGKVPYLMNCSDDLATVTIKRMYRPPRYPFSPF